MKERRGLVVKVNRRHSRPANDEAEATLKWRLLRGAPGFRPWTSLDECRRCVLCERTFSGREVRLERDALGGCEIHCPTPGCPSTPSQWIHPGNPLVSEEAWRDWVKLLDCLCEEPSPRKAFPATRASEAAPLPPACQE